uniref:Odorant binding protein n=1 Tax=Athetis dissimilis TaxID=1737331 RepID=A0A4D6Q606_ATHDI|nr:odorant binding protein [Athetis dissimilis]
MRTGFMNDKGQYVLYPGLTYVRQFTNYEAYTNLEAIAKRCESVKEETVSDGVAGCQMGSLIAACFLREFLSQGIRF